MSRRSDAEFKRIQTAVKDEFDWLYETEHYEPAVGLYEPTNTDVACRLKNPPPDASQDSLLSVVDRSWELLDRAEVEHRMGARPSTNDRCPTMSSVLSQFPPRSIIPFGAIYTYAAV